MTEIYTSFVLEAGLDPEYVLDKMQMYEVQTLLKNWHTKQHEQWDQTRWLAYIVVNMLSKEKVTQQQLAQFPWDGEDEPENDHTHVTADEVKRLMERAKLFEK